MSLLARLLLVGLTRLLVGAGVQWRGCGPDAQRQRIYFANHCSHIDTLAIWSALPPALRRQTHVVAARDYWSGGLRRYIAVKVLQAVLIDRHRERDEDPLAPLAAMLEAGGSLILFPEGTRGDGALPGAFRAGLFHLAQRFPGVELVPIYLDNLYRAMPKGLPLPIPLICSVRIGTPLVAVAGEERAAFLDRARAAVTALA